MANAKRKPTVRIVDEEDDEPRRRRRKKPTAGSKDNSKRNMTLAVLGTAVVVAGVTFMATKHIDRKGKERREVDEADRERDLERIARLLHQPVVQQVAPVAAIPEAPPQPERLMFSFMEDD